MAIEAEFVSHGKPSDEESELFVCLDKDIYKFAKLVVAKALAQRTWVELTEEEIKTICVENGWDSSWQSMRFAHAIEAKLKEKNT